MNWFREKLLPGMVLVSVMAIFVPGIVFLSAGLSSNLVIFLAEVLKPHRKLINKSIYLGTNTALLGIAGISGCAAIATIYDTVTDRHTEDVPENQNIEVFEKPNIPYRCTKCKYYSDNPLLPCAVHPIEMKEDCQDWDA
ncbi:MAG: hypothetical protein QNJ49_17355 [Mastigocoleus sp. MO_167.B18]|uniref:hypothetical protein n=1 Tax=Mastigocoleus sp. MO_188.B34 TaxID=3036635 RepID=UPI002625551B|nr:hypothetical protein [Mastigocoleus sp. MO_188.B34]MDJ0693757.1 hypothetical protein [Mastigocoleus sp. MO_188.B34]MDJ0775166.1 hypothetical protein [Mastigocoleus sp. MO_167.B18]